MQCRQISTWVAASNTEGAFAPPASEQLTKRKKISSIVSGPVTLYSEFRVVQSQHDSFQLAIQAYGLALKKQSGFLALTLKQMVGDSTMVKNYPETYKGVLANAYLDGAEMNTLPLFFSLFVRFDSAENLAISKADKQFDQTVLPYLHGISIQDGKQELSTKPMAMNRDIFQTVMAGDRHGIYHTETELLKFLMHPVDVQPGKLITVENHVFINNKSMTTFELKVAPLLKVAQQTFQPIDTVDSIGLPGSPDNRNYRKAMSTEILRKAMPDGNLRAYIMHGIWESVWDHENSHLDPRFKQASSSMRAMVKIGPVEPFYLTRSTVI